MNIHPRTHIRIALFLAFGLMVVITTLPAKKDNGNIIIPIPPEVSVPYSPIEAPIPDQVMSRSTADWLELTIKPGENLSTIFKREGLSAADLQAIMDIGDDVVILRRILPGKSLDLKIGPNGELESLRYYRNNLQTLLVEKRDGQYFADIIHLDTETITAFRVAEIEEDSPNLFLAGKKAGLSDNILMKLSYIFQWDISFALDLRQGDSFALLYEEIYAEGVKAEDGKILAATFVNMGNSYTAVRYRENGKEDFYTPDGMSMRKAFIRDPVHFSHVSSQFNMRRLHPIHKRVMPHRGIDFAANKGTPVVASGEGIVTLTTRNNPSGKYVVIQHGEQYTTKYLHLSRFANGIKPGKTVRQGQTIGYVGDTGWATAPHLHYEFLVNGVHRNPRTVKLPKANPIQSADIDHFRKTTSGLLMQLAAIQGKSAFAQIEVDSPN